MLCERGPDGGVFGFQVGRLDALESPGVGERLGGDIGSNTRLVVVKLVTLAAVQHLSTSVTPFFPYELGFLISTHPKNLEDITVRLITSKLIPRPVKAEHKLLGDRSRSQRHSLCSFHCVYALGLSEVEEGKLEEGYY